MKTIIVILTITSVALAAKPVQAPPTQPEEIRTRSIVYKEHEVPVISTRLHYTTVFVLPKGERIMDLVCGDKANWTINGADGTNFAYIKPEKAGARTNLNLVAASGNVYSFLLSEGTGPTDVKLFVNIEEPDMLITMASAPKWALQSELDAAQSKADEAAKKVEAVAADARKAQLETEARAAQQLSTFRSNFPSSLTHDYVFKPARHFGVKAIAHNAQFTYIWANPSETPSLYEVQDGKPSLINFEFANGVYIVPKVLDAGYLAIGKRRLAFKRED